MSLPKPTSYADLADVQKEINRVANMTEQQLCDHIILGNFILFDNIHPDDAESLDLPLISEWELNLLPPSGSRKSYILRIDARTPRTRSIWQHGQETMALRIGLNKRQAAQWASSDVGAKYSWLRLLQRVIATPSALMAYMEYDKQHRSRTFDVEKWAADYEIQERMRPERRVQFIKLLKHCMT